MTHFLKSTGYMEENKRQRHATLAFLKFKIGRQHQKIYNFTGRPDSSADQGHTKTLFPVDCKGKTNQAAGNSFFPLKFSFSETKQYHYNV